MLPWLTAMCCNLTGMASHRAPSTDSSSPAGPAGIDWLSDVSLFIRAATFEEAKWHCFSRRLLEITLARDELIGCEPFVVFWKRWGWQCWIRQHRRRRHYLCPCLPRLASNEEDLPPTRKKCRQCLKLSRWRRRRGVLLHATW